MQLSSALEGCDAHYVTTIDGLPERSGLARFSIVPDCNQKEIVGALRCFLSVARIVLGVRPCVVVSTGALPGLMALLVGRAMRAHTVWIDSVANAEELSLSGKAARRIAHLCLTQWEHLAAETGATFRGSVL